MPQFLGFLGIYFEKQVIQSITGGREVTSSQFAVMEKLGTEIIVPFLLAFILYLAIRRPVKWRNQRFRFFLLLGLVSSLPWALSPKQMGSYIFPSFPFYAMAIATFFENSAAVLEQNVERSLWFQRFLKIGGICIFLIALGGMVIEKGHIRNEIDFHTDFTSHSIHIEPGSLISVCPPGLTQWWSLVANMQRQYKASLTEEPGQKYLSVPVDHQCEIPDGYNRVSTHEPKWLLLFKREQ
jgi:hypothetical protein